MPHFLHAGWEVTRDTIIEFFNDNALSKGAALAFYTAFALAPVLLIAIAVAGVWFGRAATRGAVVAELSGVMGKQSSMALQALLAGAFHHQGSGIIATIIGGLTLLVTATGVFAELQYSLNEIWRAVPVFTTFELFRARVLSLGLIAALAFLLIVSLAFSAALTAAGAYFTALSAEYQIALHLLNFLFSFVLLAVVFAAIYKVLPDREIAWKDVAIGAITTAVLFNIGKYAISLYIGGSAIATSYGSAGSLIVLMVWIYYSTQIFFLGAEFTKIYAIRRGRFAEGIHGKDPDAR